jgi:hypothetical protein
MSNSEKKEKIVPMFFVSGTSTKPIAKNDKKLNVFNNHSVNVDSSKTLQQSTNEEDIFVSPVLSSFKVKMTVRMNGRVNPISVDDENIVFLDD